jgi:hypothetical protein
MNSTRLNNRVFVWSSRLGNGNCKNWPFRVKTCRAKFYPDTTSDINDFSRGTAECIRPVCDNMMHMHIDKWKAILARETGTNGRGNMLRTYRLFKTSYAPELYVKNNMPRGNRSAYAKFRCGVARLKPAGMNNWP